MNLESGLNRLALVILWIGGGIGALLVFVGLYALMNGGDWTNRFGNFALFAVFGAVVFGMAFALAWIIRGFASPKKQP